MIKTCTVAIQMQPARTPTEVSHALAITVTPVMEWHAQVSSYSTANNDCALIIEVKLVFGSLKGAYFFICTVVFKYFDYLEFLTL